MTTEAKDLMRKLYSTSKIKKKVKPKYRMGRPMTDQEFELYVGIGNGNCSPAEAPKYLHP